MATEAPSRETHDRREDEMANYTGGEKVGGGYYWNLSTWAVETIGNEGGRLGDPNGARYVKVPFPALFLIIPLLGALFLMFLPFIGFGLFAYAIAKKVAGAVKQGGTELAATVQPGSFAAGSAYFTGKPGEEADRKASPAPSPELEELEKEIASRKEK
jgi:hypothetical protein